jgi:two-component system, OmpR family, sensor histidine kinase QseC
VKLLSKYNRINIVATIGIFLTGSVAFYFVLRHILIRQLDESLVTEQEEVVQYVKQFNKLPVVIQTDDQQVYFNQTSPVLKKKKFYSLYKLNPIEKHKESFRELHFSVLVNGTGYEVIVSKSQTGTEDLLQLIILVTIGMIALILITGFFINRTILSRIWKPFYQTIDKIKNYHLSAQQPLQLPPTLIDEFTLLNENISGMTVRTQREYKNLKEFTGNAAHEMQTPLAVIRTKLDLLMQNENLLAYYAQPVQEIEQAVHKLSRLYHSLLLLTKIENQQFELNESVQLDEIIKHKLNELTEITDAKKIVTNVNLVPVSIIFHQQLAEILTGNLLNNAIRYNQENGILSITLTAREFTIANTSALPALDDKKVFQRFYRHTDTKQDGNGLGLSIVKQICDVAGFGLSYNFINEQHIISVFFNTVQKDL